MPFGLGLFIRTFMSFTRRITLLVLFVVAAAVVVVYFFLRGDAEQWVGFVVNKDTHWTLFIGLMLVLPIFAFPISAFLVLAGIKFGFAMGSLVTLLAIPIHLIVSFMLARSLLKPYLVRMLQAKDYQLPRIPRDRTLVYASLFVMIPGPPYFLKNYLLALSEIPFGYYFAINWVIELAICIPVVGLGESVVEMNWKMMMLFAGLIAALYLAGRWLKGRLSEPNSS